MLTQMMLTQILSLTFLFCFHVHTDTDWVKNIKNKMSSPLQRSRSLGGKKIGNVALYCKSG